ncbi:MAG: 4-hydroxy-3-methylbut-2-enyl diphosphate reductase [Phycisphaerae bacterium]
MSTDNPINGNEAFGCELVDRIRASNNLWELPGGQIRLPRTFGFCRGVKRALTMLDQAVRTHKQQGKRLILLGQIIHNPWVNQHFADLGVSILEADQRENLEQHILPEDVAIIPAFGVPLPIEKRLYDIGCEVIDTTCGDVLHLWKWAGQAAAEGYGVFIFGRANHDETVVTKSRLHAGGGKYLVAGNLSEVRTACDLLARNVPAEQFRKQIPPDKTNAESLEPFSRLAQVSQTTMLFNDTMKVREMLTDAFQRRFGADAQRRLQLQPTVCRATQDRQNAAEELCGDDLDLVIVVGGFGSSNTRHLFELARSRATAYFIETADAISEDSIESFDPSRESAASVAHWLPDCRPVRIGILAGASTPEIVIGKVLEKLSGFLAKSSR